MRRGLTGEAHLRTGRLTNAATTTALLGGMARARDVLRMTADKSQEGGP